MPRRSSRGGVKASTRPSTSTPRGWGRPRQPPFSASKRSSSPDDSASSPDPLDVISDASDRRHRPAVKARRVISSTASSSSSTSSSSSGSSRRSHLSHSAEEVEDEAFALGTERKSSSVEADSEVDKDEWAVFREEGDRSISSSTSDASREPASTVNTPDRRSHPFRLSPNRGWIMLPAEPAHGASPQRTLKEDGEDSNHVEQRDSVVTEGEGTLADTEQVAEAEASSSTDIILQKELGDTVPDAMDQVVSIGQNGEMQKQDVEDIPSGEDTSPKSNKAGSTNVTPAEKGSLQHLEDSKAEGQKAVENEGSIADAADLVGPDVNATRGPMEDIISVAPLDQDEGPGGTDGTMQVDEDALRESIRADHGFPEAAVQPTGEGDSIATVEAPEDARAEMTTDTAPEQPPPHEAKTTTETGADDRAPTAITPAPTSPLKGEEEGEEELDEDDLPNSEQETTYADDDVDMEEASAAAAVNASDTPTKDSKPKSVNKKKTAASKPKSKGPAKAAVTAAAKKASKASKSKSKVDDLKGNKSKASRATPDSIYGTSVSIASAELAQEDTPDPATDRVWCICRKRESEDDDEVMMVGCESCDDWFHPACVGLTDDQVKNLDVYICRSCERSTKQKTIYKKTCKRDGCDKTLGTRESKYCSDLCAYKVMKAFADSMTNKKTLKQISTAFTGYPKPSSVHVIHHATIEPIVTAQPTPAEQLMAAVQSQLTALSSALSIVRRRQDVLRQAIDHAESLAPVLLPVEENRSSKSKRKGGGGPTEDKQCAWDSRLIWTDEEVKSRGDTLDVEPSHEVCELAKRRCDKHSGWQKTIAFSLEVEERQLERQHQALVEQCEGLTKSADVAKESEHVRTVFRERLTAKRRA